MTDTAVTEREFPTLDVISAMTGTLVSDMHGVYRVLSHTTGRPLFIHELLPAASLVAQEALASSWPWMASIPRGSVTELREWCTAVVAEHGDTLPVPAGAGAW